MSFAAIPLRNMYLRVRDALQVYKYAQKSGQERSINQLPLRASSFSLIISYNEITPIRWFNEHNVEWSTHRITYQETSGYLNKFMKYSNILMPVFPPQLML